MLSGFSIVFNYINMDKEAGKFIANLLLPPQM